MGEKDQGIPTFLNVGACQIGAIPRTYAGVVIFGASEATPCVAGEPSHAAAAPDAIRAAMADYASDLTRWDFDEGAPLLDKRASVFDAGNLPTDPARAEYNRELICSAVTAIQRSGAVPFALGGDDSVPIPFLEAFKNSGPITIIQIDAHLDWRDECDGLRHTSSSTMRRASEMPWVERIIQVGIRGIGGSRRNDLDDALKWGVHIVTAAIFHRDGVQAVLEHVPNGARCVVTIDCSGLDPSAIPAVRFPQPGGLLYGEVIDLLDALRKRARIAGFDIVELMPSRDVQSLGALVAARLVCKMLAIVRRRRP